MDTETSIPKEEFERFASLIYQEVGIKLPDSKQVMLASRLRRRLAVLGLNSFKDYLAYVETEGRRRGEVTQLINAVTTNKTAFFRESPHFDYLRRWMAEGWIKSPGKTYRIWSCACSTGEEPYTIAITAHQAADDAGATARSLVQILATDIDTDVLTQAQRAVYRADGITSLSLECKKRFFLRSLEDGGRSVMPKREVREMVQWSNYNLMSSSFPTNDKFDAIFCRNVMIYFDTATRRQLVCKLVSRLHIKGLLFVGMSESLQDPNVDLRSNSHAVYEKFDSTATVPGRRK